MARKAKKHVIGSEELPVNDFMTPPRKGGFVPIYCPSGDRRHMTGIREGLLSSEIFCRNPQRRIELGLPSLAVAQD